MHRVVKFRQKPWMKQYIEYNTRQRAQATSEFEKEFYKLFAPNTDFSIHMVSARVLSLPL